MAIRDIFKINRKTFINPRGWLDYDALKSQNQTIWDVLKNTLRVPKAEREESFTQAMQRLGLTEEDVTLSAQRYRIYAILFAIVGVFILFYSCYLLFLAGTFKGFLLALTASGVAFAQAFKFDFWSLQMRERKLGLTLDDWKRSLLGDKRPSA